MNICKAKGMRLRLIAILLCLVLMVGIIPVQVFADDGYSGVNFERPAFRRMLDLIEDGKIGVIITKDYCAIIGLNQKDLENQGILA